MRGKKKKKKKKKKYRQIRNKIIERVLAKLHPLRHARLCGSLAKERIFFYGEPWQKEFRKQFKVTKLKYDKKTSDRSLYLHVQLPYYENEIDRFPRNN